MLNEFKQYLLGIGKSENTALNYCDKVKLYFKWCLDSFGSEPQQLYRANVLDYISYMKTIKRYSPKSVNNHLSSLRSFNEFLIFSGRQTELAIVKNDFMKIQTQYANPCTVEQKDVEAFRQRLLEGGNKRDFAIVTLYTYTGIRRSECVNLRLDQINLIAKEIYVVGKGDKQRTVYLNDKTVHAIREYLKVRNSDSPYLFVSRQSEKMAASRINQIFNQYYCAAVLSLTAIFAMSTTAFAAGDPLTVVNNLSDFIFGFIRAIGLILLGFGIVQVGLSLKSHDPSQRANGFLTLAGGIIIVFAKEILTLITG